MIDLLIVIGCTIALGIALYFALCFAGGYLLLWTIAEIVKTFSGGESDRW